MKRCIYLGLILSMLLLTVFPPAIRAEDTRTPFDYLSQEQQAYASAVRGGVAEAKGFVSSARADLGTSFLQGYMEWSTAVYKTLGALNGSIGKLKALTPAEGFSDVNAKCQALPEASMGRLYAAFSFGGGPESLIEIAQMVGELEGELKAYDGRLDAILASVDATVQRIAKAQAAAEDMLNAWLSCDDMSLD